MSKAQTLTEWMELVGPIKVLTGMSELDPQATMVVLNADFEVLYWSRTAQELLGRRNERLLSNQCQASNTLRQLLCDAHLVELGIVRKLPLSLETQDGRPVHFSMSARAFFDSRGTFAGVVGILHHQREQTRAGSRRIVEEAARFHGLVSRDPSMVQIFATIRNVAETEATVLVRGESGSGKELVARAIHAESHRSAAPFVAVSCAALTPTLLESELFGHVKGAFTGAVNSRSGLFRQANGGTLFLDEVAELPFELQAKLLRVLEERIIVPVGSSKQQPVEVRVISATHRALRQEVKEGRFREDLMFRLRVVPFFLPPLRNRRGDVELLLWHFIESFNLHGPRQVKTVEARCMQILLDYPWPGNARELKNVVEYAFAVGRGEELLASELPPEFYESMAAKRSGERRIASPEPFIENQTPGELLNEQARIEHALQLAHGQVGKAAELLGISRPTLWRKRKKYGIL